MYEEAFKYAMEELHKQYKAEDKESDFIFNFNVNYVEDSINVITVSVASSFMKLQVTNKGSLKIIENKLKEVTGLQNLKVECIVNENEKKSDETNAIDNELKSEIKKNDEELSSKESNKKKKEFLLNEKFTFETFIPGDNSKFAYNASLTVAKNPGKQYNPILLYGGSGLGKTHLMQAIGNYIYQNTKEKLKICYISAESFTNDFLDSLKTKKTNEFKNKYRNLDVLLLDDIHFLQNKEQTQEELFYTFNALSDKKAQMVFTCDRPIKEIKNMTNRLVSRLANGLCIDLQPPNYETRVAILQKKIELMGKTLDSEIIDYIAKHVETNVRELETALKKVFGYEELCGEKTNLDTTKMLLKDILDSNNAENISLDIIQKVIADNYQISISDLKSKKRDKKYVIPRQIAIYISRELTEMSYTELGNEFGGKDHSTIMTAYRKVADQIKTDPTMETKIELFIREIKQYKR
ncbi:MAG: chromosomal replication initiator protein DnaA [Treponema sp.]|nr:chromosomal replication initiator protein DnaA [Treponema sp.]